MVLHQLFLGIFWVTKLIHVFRLHEDVLSAGLTVHIQLDSPTLDIIVKMTKPKVYVSRIIAEKGLADLQEVCDLHIWREPELMPRDMQVKLFSDCTVLLATTDIRVDRELLEACP